MVTTMPVWGASLHALLPPTSELTQKDAPPSWTPFPRFAPVRSHPVSSFSFTFQSLLADDCAMCAIRLVHIQSVLRRATFWRVVYAITLQTGSSACRVVMAFLSQWTSDGHVRELRGLRTQYKFPLRLLGSQRRTVSDSTMTKCSGRGRWA